MPAAVDYNLKEADASAEKIGSEPGNGDTTLRRSTHNRARSVASAGNVSKGDVSMEPSSNDWSKINDEWDIDDAFKSTKKIPKVGESN